MCMNRSLDREGVHGTINALDFGCARLLDRSVSDIIISSLLQKRRVVYINKEGIYAHRSSFG